VEGRERVCGRKRDMEGDIGRERTFRKKETELGKEGEKDRGINERRRSGRYRRWGERERERGKW
jgi:hypothetical protein